MVPLTGGSRRRHLPADPRDSREGIRLQERRGQLSNELDYEVGGGNVFADQGREDADEMLVRAELLGTNQPTVSDLKRGRLSKFHSSG